MKTYFFKSLMPAVIILTMFACESESSSDVNQDRIYIAYSFKYDANEDISTAAVRFRFGNKTGTLLELSEPSEINVNDELMTFYSTLAHYSKQFAGFVPEAAFVWRDTDGNEYRNTITLTPIDFPDIEKISRSSSFELLWEGEALSADEYVQVRITDVSGEASELFVQNSEGSTGIIFPKDELEELLPGEAYMEMHRGISLNPQETTEAGGILSGQYNTEGRTIILE